MGSSLSYLATKDIPKEEMWEGLKLSPIFGDEASKFERTRNQKIGATLENGWYVIVDLSEHLQKQNDLLAKLSEKTCVLVGSIEEHVMDARVTCWQNGKKVWEVIHNAETSDDHLQVEGTPPAEFGAIKEQALEQGEEDDGVDYYFEIPVALYHQITGYRYDQHNVLEDFEDRQILKSIQHLG